MRLGVNEGAIPREIRRQVVNACRHRVAQDVPR
jgi:hypothetical protein